MRRPFSTLAIAATLACARHALSAQIPGHSQLAEQVKRIAEDFYRSNRSIDGRKDLSTAIPGLAVGVIAHGQVAYKGGFGVARLSEGRAITTATLFHMASVTKVFTATAVMQLASEGKVDLDGRVTQYIPWFRMKDPRAAEITVRQLLTHTAGLPDVTDYRWSDPEYDPGSLERYVRALADSSLVSAPGQMYEYNNLGYEVLAQLVEEVSGLPFEDYVRQRILTPVGMRRSTLLMAGIDSSALAWGYHADASGTYAPTPYYPYNRPHAGSSTLHSTVDDMMRWALVNLNRGVLDGVRILPATAYDAMWKQQRDITPPPRAPGTRPPAFANVGIGLAWELLDRHGAQLVSKNGGDIGFRTALVLCPGGQDAVVVMTNSEANISLLVLGLLDAVLADTATTRTPPSGR
jgi:CubicO group peptidase (beta-lactamase class C family)